MHWKLILILAMSELVKGNLPVMLASGIIGSNVASLDLCSSGWFDHFELWVRATQSCRLDL